MREILQAGLEIKLTLHQLYILLNSQGYSRCKLMIFFYIYNIGYLNGSILEKSY